MPRDPYVNFVKWDFPTIGESQAWSATFITLNNNNNNNMIKYCRLKTRKEFYNVLLWTDIRSKIWQKQQQQQ